VNLMTVETFQQAHMEGQLSKIPHWLGCMGHVETHLARRERSPTRRVRTDLVYEQASRITDPLGDGRRVRICQYHVHRELHIKGLFDDRRDPLDLMFIHDGKVVDLVPDGGRCKRDAVRDVASRL
jgi:hypothetical protein